MRTVSSVISIPIAAGGIVALSNTATKIGGRPDILCGEDASKPEHDIGKNQMHQYNTQRRHSQSQLSDCVTLAFYKSVMARAVAVKRLRRAATG